jgi:murein DD-endopeptidase MepM/ murein hydrolase activator NlpD
MAFTLLLIGLIAQSPAASDLRVEILPQELHPGEAVLIRMAASNGIAHVHASLKDQKILFFPEPDRKSWAGLAGLDLKVSTGVHILDYHVRFEDGTEMEGTYGLNVLKKEFPVEKITVDRKYVHLSEEDLARHRGEKKILGGIFRTQSPERPWEDGFAVPVDVEKGSRFGLRRIINGEPRSPHSGADLKAGSGTPVGATNAGRVVFAGDLFFSGNTVILDHGGGLYSLYAHLEKITAEKEREVGKGEVIGYVGATGRVTGPHLHWGVKLNGARIDPFSLVTLPLSSSQPQQEEKLPLDSDNH